MPVPQLFRRIAERYLAVAILVWWRIPEAAAFASYHAFESIGAAWIRHHGLIVPWPHPQKITLFVNLSAPHPFGLQVAQAAITFHGIRNNFLYPIQIPTGLYDLPERHVSRLGALDLWLESRRLVRRLAPLI